MIEARSLGEEQMGFSFWEGICRGSVCSVPLVSNLFALVFLE